MGLKRLLVSDQTAACVRVPQESYLACSLFVGLQCEFIWQIYTARIRKANANVTCCRFCAYAYSNRRDIYFEK